MRLRSLICATTLVLTVTGFTTAGYATPITYQISGVASGNIGGTAFSNALVTLTATGNTAGVVTVFGGPFVAEALNTTKVTIQGVGTATITDPTEIFSSVIPIVPDTGLPNLPYVVIGRIDSPPDLESFTGIGFLGSSALLGYDLRTSIGPITAVPGGIGFNVHCGPGPDPCLSTTLGTLSFTANFSPTGVGTFSATTVPEPATLLLVGSGVAVLALRSRSRKRG